MAKKVGYEVGHKMGEDSISPIPDKEYKNKICYPSIHLTEKELPYLKGTDVGDKVSFLCLFEITGMRQNKKEEKEYDLDLQKVAEDSEMRISKALEKFMGEHEEVGDKPKDKETNETD